MSVHSTLCAHVGVWRENPRGVHDRTETAAEDEERLDAHRAPTVWTLWRRYRMTRAPVAAFPEEQYSMKNVKHVCIGVSVCRCSCLKRYSFLSEVLKTMALRCLLGRE